MGQLERYGLYVLAIVVMLIVGVAVFGNEPSQSGALATEVDRPWDEIGGRDPGVGDSGASGLGSWEIDDDGLQAELQRVPPQNEGGLSKLDEYMHRGGDGLGGGAQGRVSEPGWDSEPLDPVRPDLDDRPEYDNGAAGQIPDVPREPDPQPSVATPATATHRVVGGDSFERIARRYYPGQNAAMVAKAIQRANPRIEPRSMQLGTELILPVYDGVQPSRASVSSGREPSGPRPSSVGGSNTYRVRVGDTLTAIARKQYGLRSNADIQRAIRLIASANGLANPNRLDQNQVLTIPAFNRESR